VEDTLSTGDEEVPDEDDEVGEKHDPEDSPEPVGAMGGDVLAIDGAITTISGIFNKRDRLTHSGLVWMASLPDARA